MSKLCADLATNSARTQVDEEAAIRANTTILLGNLASHLSEPACKRVLLNAFTRALKDGFPPARVAGLKVPSEALSSNLCPTALSYMMQLATEGH